MDIELLLLPVIAYGAFFLSSEAARVRAELKEKTGGDDLVLDAMSWPYRLIIPNSEGVKPGPPK